MHVLKPAPIFPQHHRNLCPICGTATYSRDGIHPQCAVQQADEPRNLKLQQKKRDKPKSEKPRQRSWNKKCPKCATEVHIRRSKCDCGHLFETR
jgi:hypothetical protein